MRAAWLAMAAAVLLARGGAAADVRPLIADVPRAGALAVTPGGQTVACVHEGTGAIVVLDRGGRQSVRVAVTTPRAGGPRPVAIGFVDDTVLAAVCRSAGEWSLRTWRLRLTEPVDADAPLQVVRLGHVGLAEQRAAHLVVGRSNGWLAVVGLEPPVVRAALGGVRIGPPSARRCPRLEPGLRPVAATMGPDGELAIVTRAEAGGRSADAVAFYGVDGRCLLDLDTGLHGIRGIAFPADGAALYAIAPAGDDQASGLWRLEAAARDGRQVIRPVLVAELPEPRALVCLDSRVVVVAQGAPDRSLVEVQARASAMPEEP